MTYGVSLITGAQIVEFTGVQDLVNLAADGELVLNTFALRASDSVFRTLESLGHDPTALTNESRLMEAVAYEAVGRLVLAGYVTAGGGADPAAFFAKATEVVRSFRPAFADPAADSPRRAAEGVPAVGHLDGSLVFGPAGAPVGGTDLYSGAFPQEV